MFAMALATDPELLVLDEPTTGLDATVEAEVLDLVEQLRDRVRRGDPVRQPQPRHRGAGVRARGRAVRGPADRAGPRRTSCSTTRGIRTRWRCCAACRGWACSKDADRLDPIPGSLPPLGAQVHRMRLRRPLPDRARDRCREEASGAGPVQRGRPLDALLLPRGGAGDPAYAAPGGGGPRLDARPAAGAARRRAAGQGVRFSGSEVVAVAVVDLELRPRRGAGAGGESGSGKTSLAKCIVGLVDADRRARMRFAGEDVRTATEARPRGRRRAADGVPEPRQRAQPEPYGRLILRAVAVLLAGVRPQSSRTRSWSTGAVGAAGATAPGRAARVAVGRPQAAGCDRALVRGQAVDGALRRADVGAGRVGAGGDPEPAGRPAAARGRLIRRSSRTTWRWCATWPTGSR